MGGRRAADPPRLQEVLGIMALVKRPGCTEDEMLRRPREFGQKRERWFIEIERKGPFLFARLVVGDQRVLGLDRHAGEVRDPVSGRIPPGWYHWDVAYPFPARRVPAFHSPKAGYAADRDVLDHLICFWHISFEPDPKGGRLL